jgi:hypothetical protein
VILSGLAGDDQPGGGGMIPRGAEDDFTFVSVERCTVSSGDVGFEVKMNDGVRAIYCSVYLTLVEPTVGLSESTDDAVREGEGGSVIVDCDSAFPFDLNTSLTYNQTQPSYLPVSAQSKHHLPVNSIIPHAVSHFSRLDHIRSIYYCILQSYCFGKYRRRR